MVELKIYNREYNVDGIDEPVFSFKTCYNINVISGDSGTGKTQFITSVQNAIDNIDNWYLECNHKVAVVTGISQLDRLAEDEKLIIIDEDTVNAYRKNHNILDLRKYKKYFILLDRGVAGKSDININAIFKISCEYSNKDDTVIKQHKIEPMYPRRDVFDYSNISSMVVEDKESGLLFWKSALKGIDVIDIGLYGNGNVINNIKYALSNYKGKCIISLDYDAGAVVMQSILRDKQIDKSRISFLKLECFEELICNSEFILSKYPHIKDKVINYLDYMDCNYKSTGHYFSKLLFDNVKVKSPIKNDGDRNVTKFYDKGMDNFKECFILDCCTYNKNDCPLFYNNDKIDGMLCNKFEFLRQFR